MSTGLCTRATSTFNVICYAMPSSTFLEEVYTNTQTVLLPRVLTALCCLCSYLFLASLKNLTNLRPWRNWLTRFAAASDIARQCFSFFVWRLACWWPCCLQLGCCLRCRWPGIGVPESQVRNFVRHACLQGLGLVFAAGLLRYGVGALEREFPNPGSVFDRWHANSLAKFCRIF